jgi:hypothetical protein
MQIATIYTCYFLKEETFGIFSFQAFTLFTVI